MDKLAEKLSFKYDAVQKSVKATQIEFDTLREDQRKQVCSRAIALYQKRATSFVLTCYSTKTQSIESDAQKAQDASADVLLHAKQIKVLPRDHHWRHP